MTAAATVEMKVRGRILTRGREGGREEREGGIEGWLDLYQLMHAIHTCINSLTQAINRRIALTAARQSEAGLPHTHGGARCSRQDHHPVQVEAG